MGIARRVETAPTSSAIGKNDPERGEITAPYRVKRVAQPRNVLTVERAVALTSVPEVPKLPTLPAAATAIENALLPAM